MVILAAPLTYLVLSIMGIGMGHSLLSVKTPPAQQAATATATATASQSSNEAATAHVVAE